jgi:hypothetical protein
LSGEQNFDIAAIFSVDPPCYLRIVDKQADCGHAEDSPAGRATAIHDRLLAPGSDGKVSVWLTADGLDLSRIAAAFNSGRKYPTSDLLIFPLETSWFRDNEAVKTDGRVECLWAKHRHYDLTLTAERRAEISDSLAQLKRKATRFGGGKLRRAFERADRDHCYSVNENRQERCICDTA